MGNEGQAGNFVRLWHGRKGGNLNLVINVNSLMDLEDHRQLGELKICFIQVTLLSHDKCSF